MKFLTELYVANKSNFSSFRSHYVPNAVMWTFADPLFLCFVSFELCYSPRFHNLTWQLKIQTQHQLRLKWIRIHSHRIPGPGDECVPPKIGQISVTANMSDPLEWLRDLLFESREKWKEIKDWKRYLSVFQLGLAEFLRWLSLLLLMFSAILTGNLSMSLFTFNL